jgi:hypothetical protein
MSTAGTWSGPWFGLEGRVPPPQHRVRKPVGMFGIRSLRAGLQLASTCSLPPPFFCPPKHNHTPAYKHRILCNINWVCYDGHISTIRAEEAYRYSITNRGTNEWLAPAIRSALAQNNLHAAHCDALSTLLTPDTCAGCVVFVPTMWWCTCMSVRAGVSNCVSVRNECQ